MSKSKSPLTILGVDRGFATTMPEALVVKAAERMFGAIMKYYHPDANEGKRPRRKLTPYNEAIEAVRKDPAGAIADLKKQSSRSLAKTQLQNLKTKIDGLLKKRDLQSQKINMLWNLVACARQDILSDVPATESKSSRRPMYNIQDLQGVAIVVRSKEDPSKFIEYLCQKKYWMCRPLNKERYGKRTPLPPGIAEKLVTEGDPGFFYDQIGVHRHLGGFDIVGSYEPKDVGNEVRQDSGIKKALTGLSSLMPPKSVQQSLSPAILHALEPGVQVGRKLVCTKKSDRSSNQIRFEELGSIVLIRIFDRSQQRK